MLSGICHINPPLTDKTVGYAAKPLNYIIISRFCIKDKPPPYGGINWLNG